MQTVATVESHPKIRKHLLRSEDGQDNEQSSVDTRPEPYYTNEEITILHTVVASAQERLDRSNLPKPLPAAVLFQAYDEVLPAFGLDPDTDHHLSALIFRVGGEHGSGTLLDKFKAILKRMGVVLEYGNDQTTYKHVQQPTGLVDIDHSVNDFSAKYGLLVLSGGQAGTSNLSTSDEGSRSFDDLEREDSVVQFQPLNAPDNPPLASQVFLNKPQADSVTSSGKQAAGGLRAPSTDQGPIHEALESETKRTATSHKRNYSAIAALDRWRSVVLRMPAAARKVRNAVTGRVTDWPAQSRSWQEAAARSSSFRSGSRENDLLRDGPTIASMTVGSDAIIHRALRARQIYLASQTFNCWATQTAFKLERDAIARRHMVRFRCFQGWTCAPASMMPEARLLEAVGAVSKLRRILTRYQEQLAPAGLRAVRVRRRKNILFILSYWTSHVKAHLSTRSRKRQKRQNSLDYWQRQSRRFSSSAMTVSHVSGLLKCRAYTCRWKRQAEEHHARSTSMRRLSAAFGALSALQTRWDRSRVEMMASNYCQTQILRKSEYSLEGWSLQTRAQAFLWRSEYVCVTKVTDRWIAILQRHAAENLISQGYSRTRYTEKLLDCLRLLQTHCSRVDRLSRRARWYIQATSLLNAFEVAVEHRKRESKLLVRRYLMMRYTQMSSRRRRRSFYFALGRWQEHVSNVCASINAVRKYQEKDAKLREASRLNIWSMQRAKVNEAQTWAIEHQKHRCLQRWKKRVLALEEQHIFASQSWANEQQRQSLKVWVIVALQGGGQAHSASMVRQRLDRENRNRALQIWKSKFVGPNGNANVSALQTPVRKAVPTRLFNTADPLFRRRSFFRRVHEYNDTTSPLHTPSRSTGSAIIPVRSVSTRLGQQDTEDDGKKFDALRSPHVTRFGHGRSSTPTYVRNAASTTPRAPIPPHVRIRSKHEASLVGDA